MFDDYTKLVLQDYETKKAAGLLPLNLSKPTPARLRDECLIAYKGRPQRKDENMLRDFFGKADNDIGYWRIVKKCAIDRFRPLINFLKKPTIRTDEKNVELLAWLIDFEPRPFQLSSRYDLNDEEKDMIDEKTGQPENDRIAEAQKGVLSPDEPIDEKDEEGEMPVFLNPQPVLNEHKYPFKLSTALIIIVVLALSGLFIYQNIRKGELLNAMGTTLNRRDACMYWTGDHYQQIPCGQKVYGTMVIALDSEKLVHFKKITKPDTLSEADIRRVFYIKYGGKIEFYTGGGPHPVYTDRSLKPLTAYIYEKYILPLKH
ncbi:hypothetical protein [Niabella soli]|uniref:Uncharacterized protein n=1 Tax=Niabella soli DSM 19437 TaxID=929713 RepID=W0F243_9BACT|nr:hypothetical protein [Niabella soli]AHF17072.1 hypothetical protein NIASO_01255 [Niabella soli DSM 19437]